MKDNWEPKRRRIFIVIVANLLVTCWVSPAQAHSEIVAADPAPGAQLSTSPARILLTFSEPIGPDSTVAVLGTNFRQIEGIHVAFVGNESLQLMATLPSLDPDLYTVQWTAVSSDGHRTSGSYAFGVTGSAMGATGNYSRLLVVVVVIIGIGVIVSGMRWRRRSGPPNRAGSDR